MPARLRLKRRWHELWMTEIRCGHLENFPEGSREMAFCDRHIKMRICTTSHGWGRGERGRGRGRERGDGKKRQTNYINRVPDKWFENKTHQTLFWVFRHSLSLSLCQSLFTMFASVDGSGVLLPQWQPFFHPFNEYIEWKAENTSYIEHQMAVLWRLWTCSHLRIFALPHTPSCTKIIIQKYLFTMGDGLL